jgi:hypothetical protein
VRTDPARDEEVTPEKGLDQISERQRRSHDRPLSDMAIGSDGA